MSFGKKICALPSIWPSNERKNERKEIERRLLNIINTMHTPLAISGRVEHLAVDFMNKGKLSLGRGQYGVGDIYAQL